MQIRLWPTLERMTVKTEISRLSQLNRILSRTIGDAPEIADEVEAALAFSRGTAQSVNFNEAAAGLITLYRQTLTIPIEHLMVTTENVSPIFLRPALMEPLRHLAGVRIGLLVVSGLRQAICPADRRFTKKKREAYEQAVSLIEELVIERTMASTRLQLIIV